MGNSFLLGRGSNRVPRKAKSIDFLKSVDFLKSLLENQSGHLKLIYQNGILEIYQFGILFANGLSALSVQRYVP